MARLLVVFLLCLPAFGGTIYCTQHDFTQAYGIGSWSYGEHGRMSHSRILWDVWLLDDPDKEAH